MRSREKLGISYDGDDSGFLCPECERSDDCLCERGMSMWADGRDAAYGKATAGNNRKVHAIRMTLEADYLTMCGTLVPLQPQTTQDALPRCRRCYGD